MPEKSYTLRELRLKSESLPGGAIRADIIFAETHAEFLRCVRAVVDHASYEFAKSVQHWHDKGEDVLTDVIIKIMKSFGIQAAHDTQYGGHCDIVVEAKNNFLWIAEAKIATSYSYILEGFDQLTTRYTTGLPGQDSGELIIYCRRPNIDKMMSKWVNKLRKERVNVSVENCADNVLCRFSTHLHVVSGLPFRIRHVPISVHFDPRA